MKAYILAFSIVFSAALSSVADDDPLEKLDEADHGFYEAIRKAQAGYRKAIADALARADKFEVFLLDSQPEKVKNADGIAWDEQLPEGFFPITPYKAQCRILSRTTLSPEDAKQILGPLQAAIGTEKNNLGPMCHFPIYGVRVWAGERILFQTSLCWRCHNLYVKYPYMGAEWSGFDGSALKDAIEALPLMTQKEIDGLNAKPQPGTRKRKKGQKEK